MKAAFLAIVPLIVTSAVAQNSMVKGIVVDPSGAAIGQAFVLFHTDALTPENPLPYDKQGRFSAELPPGFYDLFIGAGGFEPNCQQLRAHSGASQSLTVALKLDAKFVKEYGDEFPAPEPFKPSKIPPELKRPPH